MTTKREYNCNLCRNSITPPYEIGKGLSPPTPGTGVYWGARGMEFRNVTQCEHHLCQACLNAVCALYVVPEEDPTPGPEGAA